MYNDILSCPSEIHRRAKGKDTTQSILSLEKYRSLYKLQKFNTLYW